MKFKLILLFTLHKKRADVKSALVMYAEDGT